MGRTGEKGGGQGALQARVQHLTKAWIQERGAYQGAALFGVTQAKNEQMQVTRGLSRA